MPDEANTAENKKRKLPIKSMLILMGIMLLEGGIFVAWMAFAKPASANAGQDDTAAVPTQRYQTTSEIDIIQCRVPNSVQGRTTLYEIEIKIVCAKEKKTLVETIRTEREGALRDALFSVVAAADPAELQEPDRETLKRQIRVVLDEFFGEDVIEEVLVPNLTPYPMGY